MSYTLIQKSQNQKSMGYENKSVKIYGALRTSNFLWLKRQHLCELNSVT